MDTNPYKPPVVFSTPSETLDHTAIRVEGKYLVLRSGTELPQRCVKTNQKITESDMRRKTYEWCSPWVALSFLISGCITIVLYFVLRKRCELTFGVHPTVRAKYRNRLIFKLLATLALFLAMPIAASTDNSGVIAAAIILFIVAFISVFLGNSPLSIAKYRQERFWIRGCSEEFLKEVGGGSPFAVAPGK